MESLFPMKKPVALTLNVPPSKMASQQRFSVGHKLNLLNWILLIIEMQALRYSHTSSALLETGLFNASTERECSGQSETNLAQRALH